MVGHHAGFTAPGRIALMVGSVGLCAALVCQVGCATPRSELITQADASSSGGGGGAGAAAGGAGGTSGNDAAAPGGGGGTSGNDAAPEGGGGALAATGGVGGASVLPGAGPLAPAVTADSPAFTRTPTWMWRPGGGGNGTFRAKLDSPDLSTGATETKNGFFTPPTPLDDGPHKLFVAERDDAGRWSPPGNAEVLVTAGPLSRYTFDNNALDTGLNRNDGVMDGPTPTPDHLGNPTGALQFDGINDGILTKVAKYGVKTNCTISLWIKTNPAEDGLYFPFAGQMGIMTRFGKETGMYVTHAGGSNSALAPVTPGVWAHLLGTFDGRAINTYINGALAATQPFPGTVDWVPDPAFGNFRGLGADYWAGALDDVRIYNHVLSAAEIQDIYTGKN